MAVRVYVEGAGCDRRQLDTATIRTYLEANGYQLVSDPGDADRILVVTCAFKQKEEDESVRRLRSLRKYGRKTVVYGCLPDIATERYEEFRDLPFVAPREIETIAEHFNGDSVPFAEVRSANVIGRSEANLVRARRRVESGLPPLSESLGRMRNLGSKALRDVFAKPEAAFNLFVCRGCMGTCSYCGIRKAIGPARSKSPELVLEEFRRGLDEGYRTFNILADDPGCYGVDLSSTLVELLGALFVAAQAAEPPSESRTANSEPIRFRIREIHPKYLVQYHSEMLELPGISLLDGILCPVQSGSDRVLALMQRQHSVDDLLQAMRSIKVRRPDVRLDTQMIVGFPTETADEFEETLRFVRDAGFDSVVVFPYDDKEGTPASALGGKVPEEEMRRRMHRAFSFFRHERIPAYYSCP